MKTRMISEIQNQMKPFLNQGQYLKLTKALLKTFKNVQIIENKIDYDENSSNENYKLLAL